MGRNQTQTKLIASEYKRRITFKKRRICVIKKAMQLSLMSGCEISLSIFWKEDGSLIDYVSSKNAIKA